jgi:signal peptidase I
VTSTVATHSKRFRRLRRIGIAVLVIGALLSVGRVRVYAFAGTSMVPAVGPGQRFIAFEGWWARRTLSRFDLVVFDLPPHSAWADRKIPWMKRLVAFPHEHVRLVGPDLFIDGQKVDSSTLYGAPRPDVAVDIVLGADQFFVLGDNLDHTLEDSRAFGPLEKSRIRGYAVYVTGNGQKSGSNSRGIERQP